MFYTVCFLERSDTKLVRLQKEQLFVCTKLLKRNKNETKSIFELNEWHRRSYGK